MLEKAIRDLTEIIKRDREAALDEAARHLLRDLLTFGSAIQHQEENHTMSHTTHTASLVNAKLFDKGLRDALAGMTKDVDYIQGACVHPVFHQITIRATKVHDGRKLQAQTIVDSVLLDDMRDGHYAFGKSIGFELAMQMLKAICESQPQEITISIKDASKAATWTTRTAWSPHGAASLPLRPSSSADHVQSHGRRCTAPEAERTCVPARASEGHQLPQLWVSIRGCLR